jgi:hypothetical protein
MYRYYIIFNVIFAKLQRRSKIGTADNENPRGIL